MDSSLEDAVDSCMDALSSDDMTELSSSVQLTGRELAACRHCCDEAENQLDKLTGRSTKELSNKTCTYAVYVC